MDEKNALESTSTADNATAETQRKTKALEFLMFVFFVAKTLSGKIFWGLFQNVFFFYLSNHILGY